MATIVEAQYAQKDLYTIDIVKHASAVTTTELESASDTDTKQAVIKDESSNLLIVSPYTELSHQLNLNRVDIQSQLLAEALTHLAPATSTYATTPYHLALNWPAVFSHLKHLNNKRNRKWIKTHFYVVEFRSTLKAEIDKPLLFALDKESHREATASGGLLKYWFGVPDESRRNLATCLWRSKEDAVAGGKGPWHKRARGVTKEMYEAIDVKGLRLTIEDDVAGWKFEKWVD